jgi:hypothetical protein
MMLSGAASSLARHQQIQARLQLEILDVKDEVARLKAELRRDQDPSKMSRIQSQIGVGPPASIYGVIPSTLSSPSSQCCSGVEN